MHCDWKKLNTVEGSANVATAGCCHPLSGEPPTSIFSTIPSCCCSLLWSNPHINSSVVSCDGCGERTSGDSNGIALEVSVLGRQLTEVEAENVIWSSSREAGAWDCNLVGGFQALALASVWMMSLLISIVGDSMLMSFSEGLGSWILFSQRNGLISLISLVIRPLRLWRDLKGMENTEKNSWRNWKSKRKKKKKKKGTFSEGAKMRGSVTQIGCIVYGHEIICLKSS